MCCFILFKLTLNVKFNKTKITKRELHVIINLLNTSFTF